MSTHQKFCVAAAAFAAAGLALSASAQVTPIGPFIGSHQEGFQIIGQWPPAGPCTFCTSIPDAFGGIATLESANGGANVHVTGGWGFVCSIGANLTPRIAASTSGGFDYVFMPGQEARKFGGYFGTNSGVAGGTVEFYDSANVLIGSDFLNHQADCQWVWHGWEFSVPVARVRVIGNYPGGGYVQMDDMEYDSAGGTVCYANCDGSTVAPLLNVDDFTCFINEFAAAQALPHEQQVTHYANCDSSSIVPALNVDDFTCFINAFATGCP
jgi:hypothetical protein